MFFFANIKGTICIKNCIQLSDFELVGTYLGVLNHSESENIKMNRGTANSPSDEKKFNLGRIKYLKAKYQNDHSIETKIMVQIDLDRLVLKKKKNVRNSIKFN